MKTEGGRSKWRWLLLPLAPLYVIYLFGALCFLAIVALSEAVGRWWAAGRLVRRMEKAGRVMSWADVEAAGVGTVIVEFPYLGWPEVRCWWTPEHVRDAAAAAQIEIPAPDWMQTHDSWEVAAAFAKWCRTVFLDGEAMFVQCARGSKDEKRVLAKVEDLQRRLRGISAVQIWTGVPEAPPRTQ